MSTQPRPPAPIGAPRPTVPRPVTQLTGAPRPPASTGLGQPRPPPQPIGGALAGIGNVQLKSVPRPAGPSPLAGIGSIQLKSVPKPVESSPLAGLGSVQLKSVPKSNEGSPTQPVSAPRPRPPVAVIKPASAGQAQPRPPVSGVAPRPITPNKAIVIPDPIAEEDDIDGPERCFGYLKKERKAGSGRYDTFFFALEDGELFAYTTESAPGSREGKEPPLDTMDLDRWAIALTSKSGLLLTPPTSLDSQVLFEEDNSREHNKWALAFNEHISWMDKIAGRVSVIPASALVQPEKAGVTAAVAAPIEDDFAKKEADDYTDRRGIRMSVRMDPKNKYAEQTMQILRDQLIKDGKMPLEFIPLEDLKLEMSSIFEKANNGDAYDEGRLDYLLKCMDLNPDYKAEKEKETAAWRKVIEPFVKECLSTMRGFIPPHVFQSTLQTLTVNDGLPAELAKRIFAKRCLWLIRISTADISKMHIAELQGRFNPEAQGLDIIELAAIFANIPQKFTNDDAKGGKEKWRLSIEECVKSYYSQNEKGTLAKLKQRNPAYKGLEPVFSKDEVYHTMHVTKSEDTYNPRASYRMIKREQRRNSNAALGTSTGPVSINASQDKSAAHRDRVSSKAIQPDF